jgi:hypothetical protein
MCYQYLAPLGLSLTAMVKTSTTAQRRYGGITSQGGIKTAKKVARWPIPRLLQKEKAGAYGRRPSRFYLAQGPENLLLFLLPALRGGTFSSRLPYGAGLSGGLAGLTGQVFSDRGAGLTGPAKRVFGFISWRRLPAPLLSLTPAQRSACNPPGPSPPLSTTGR